MVVSVEIRTSIKKKWINNTFVLTIMDGYTWAFWARPDPARARPGPGPPTNFTRRAWAEILKPAKCFFARARPEMLFLVVLQYKMRERSAQARARPENWGPMRPVGWSWAEFFRPEITEFFSARPEPGPARKMLRSMDGFT
jgi:hypothetical protein